MSEKQGIVADEKQEENKKGFSRRLFMKGVGTSVVSTAALSSGVMTAVEKEANAASSPSGPGLVDLTLNINGKKHQVKAEPRETLLEVMRNRLDITGPKLVCNHGNCGACTVLIDGETAYSCMMLAIQAQGREIKTIEGISQDGLHPVQQAFKETDAQQCGFCTPGFVMSMAAVYDKNKNASTQDYKDAIAGHICRCGTYTQIFEAAGNLEKRGG